MLSKFHSYVNRGFKHYAIEIYTVKGIDRFRVIELAQNSNNLEFKNTWNCEDRESVKGHLKKEKPLVVVFNTKNVITRFVKREESINDIRLLNQYYPNLDQDQFYYEVTSFRDQAIICISKKDEIDSRIEKIQSDSGDIVSFSLGLSVLSVLEAFLKDSEIHTASQKIILDSEANDVSIQSTSNSNCIYTLNGLNVKNYDLMAFAGIVNSLNTNPLGYGNTSASITKLREDFSKKRQYKIILKSTVLVILILLTANFLIFNYYFTENSRLQGIIASNEQFISQFESLKTRVEIKESRLQAQVASSNSSVTRLLDYMAAELPEDIRWEDVSYQPIQGALSNNKPISFERSTVVILGTTSSQGSLYDWILSLEKNTEIDKLITEQYELQPSGKADFSLRILLRNETSK
jgi:hypothetical protein